MIGNEAYWVVGIIAIAVIVILIGYYYSQKYKSPSAKDKSINDKVLSEKDYIPTMPDVPQDIFKYGWELWGWDGRRAMRIHDYKVVVTFTIFIICYVWGILTLFINALLGTFIICGGAIGCMVGYALVQLYITKWGYEKLGNLDLIVLNLASLDGITVESGRFHFERFEEVNAVDFKEIIDNEEGMEKLQDYEFAKSAFNEEVEIYKEKKKVDTVPLMELKKMQIRTKYFPSEFLDIQLEVMKRFKSPLTKDLVKEIHEIEQKTGLILTKLYLTHPDRPNEILIKLIIVTKHSTLKDHLGKTNPVTLFLRGNSFDTKEWEIDIQLKHEGINLLPICAVRDSFWTRQHPKEIFGSMVTIFSKDAHFGSIVYENWDSVRLSQIVKEQGRLLAEKERRDFKVKALGIKEATKILKLEEDDLKKNIDKGGPLLSPRDKTIVISLVGAAAIICFTVFIIWAFGGS